MGDAAPDYLTVLRGLVTRADMSAAAHEARLRNLAQLMSIIREAAMRSEPMPRYRTLAAQIGVSDHRIGSMLTTLERLDMLRCTRRDGTSFYHVWPDWLRTMPISRSAIMARVRREGTPDFDGGAKAVAEAEAERAEIVARAEAREAERAAYEAYWLAQEKPGYKRLAEARVTRPPALAEVQEDARIRAMAARLAAQRQARQRGEGGEA